MNKWVLLMALAVLVNVFVALLGVTGWRYYAASFVLYNAILMVKALIIAAKP